MEIADDARLDMLGYPAKEAMGAESGTDVLVLTFRLPVLPFPAPLTQFRFSFRGKVTLS